jgi:hypothetical protein
VPGLDGGAAERDRQMRFAAASAGTIDATHYEDSKHGLTRIVRWDLNNPPWCDAGTVKDVRT